MASVTPKKRRTTLARQLKIKKTRQAAASESYSPFDVVDCATNIEANVRAHRREVAEGKQACATAIRDMDSVEEGPDLKDKLRQLAGMFRTLNEKYAELLQYTVKLEGAVELAINSRHQYALEIARGDVESASESALMSSVHR